MFIGGIVHFLRRHGGFFQIVDGLVAPGGKECPDASAKT